MAEKLNDLMWFKNKKDLPFFLFLLEIFLWLCKRKIEKKKLVIILVKLKIKILFRSYFSYWRYEILINYDLNMSYIPMLLILLIK